MLIILRRRPIVFALHLSFSQSLLTSSAARALWPSWVTIFFFVPPPCWRVQRYDYPRSHGRRPTDASMDVRCLSCLVASVNTGNKHWPSGAARPLRQPLCRVRDHIPLHDSVNFLHVDGADEDEEEDNENDDSVLGRGGDPVGDAGRKGRGGEREEERGERGEGREERGEARGERLREGRWKSEDGAEM